VVNTRCGSKVSEKAVSYWDLRQRAAPGVWVDTDIEPDGGDLGQFFLTPFLYSPSPSIPVGKSQLTDWI
jgi:hypothetical protein